MPAERKEGRRRRKDIDDENTSPLYRDEITQRL